MSAAKEAESVMDKIDIYSDVPVYEQIEIQIQSDIAAGRLKPMDRITSVRELSGKLKVNPNTVAKAYRDLEVMGFVFTRRGKGIFVKKDADEKCREACRRRFIEGMYQTVCEAKAAGMSKGDVTKAVNEAFAQEET